MEVDDSELLELVNEFRDDSDSSPASTLDEIPTDEIIDVLFVSDYISDEINGYMMVPDIKVTKLKDDEVLKYNPEFDWWISRPWTTTLIKDFDGEINYYVSNDDSAHIIGVGNVNFYTTQTGL